MLRIHNSKTGTKSAFTPLLPKHVRLYVCGMTVYDYCHIGHARVMVFFDTVVRYLRTAGNRVTYVRNITDIDDKIIARARENNEPTTALTERFIIALHEDCAALGIMPPDQEPRATTSLHLIIDMITQLEKSGLAYVGSSGTVYYRTRAFPAYGALSGKKLDELKSGIRIAVEKDKEDPLDFVLWKPAKPDEPAWESPWGAGRPGWHIECSAMSCHALGNHFDIHGGGMDLLFPHHENEVAQSVGANNEPFAETWMHVGFVRVGGEKMSKSLGNFFTIREVLERFHPEAVRLFLLGSHYRKPLYYDDTHLLRALEGLKRLYRALEHTDTECTVHDAEITARFHTAMENDFNTPAAVAVLFDCARLCNSAKDTGDRPRANNLAATLRILAAPLGLLQHDPQSILQHTPQSIDTETIERLIAERNDARAQKEYARADAVRDRLATLGIVLTDTGDATEWHVEHTGK